MLQHFPALVLNADFRPASLYPLSVKDAWEAIKNVCEDVVSVVEEYDQVVRSPSTTMRIPSVIALRTFVKPSNRVALTSRNVFLRDRLRCQYCGEHRDLTVDHVHPRSRGGLHVWSNVASACHVCNGKKGDSVGAMHPMKVPREPTPAELHALARAEFRHRLHATWLDYLPAEAA